MDMLGEADVVVDATPEGMGAQNLQATYKKLGIKAIFEGGRSITQLGSRLMPIATITKPLERITFG